MKKRLITPIILALALIATLAAPVLANGKLRDHYDEDDDRAFWGAQYGYSIAQSFETRAGSYDGVSIEIKAYRAGNPGIINVAITRVDSKGRPRDDWLTSGTFDGNRMTTTTNGEWYEIEVDPYHLSDDTEYAIVVEVPSRDSGAVWWRENSIDPRYKYGCVIDMDDDGDWKNPDESRDRMFRIYGVEWYAYTENDIDKLIKKLATETNDLETQVDDLSSQIDDLSSQVSAFSDERGRLSSDLGAIVESKLETISNEVASVRDEVTNVHSEVAAVGNKLEDVEDGIANARGEVAVLEDEVESVSSRLTQILVLAIITLVSVVMLVLRKQKRTQK